MGKYVPSPRTAQQIEQTFIYHAVKEDQAGRYVQIRAEAKIFAQMLATNCPESRELSTALTLLQQSVMMANAAIAVNE